MPSFINASQSYPLMQSMSHSARTPSTLSDLLELIAALAQLLASLFFFGYLSLSRHRATWAICFSFGINQMPKHLRAKDLNYPSKT